ncbi:hypothetical protein BVX98_03310 [bacterium F11]|nr:hypothetical protein BVX98_03310 [bacterium F11]
MNRFILSGLLFGFSFMINGCSVNESEVNVINASFSGTWKTVSESDNKTDKVTVNRISSDGKRFRFETYSEGGSFNSNMNQLFVFDGEYLHASQGYSSEFLGNSQPIEGSESRKLSKAEIEKMKIWVPKLPGSTKKGPGETILGRETVIYEIEQPIIASFVDKSEFWIDKETGLILRKKTEQMSKRAQKVVRTELMECIELNVGPVDESAFSG